MKKFSAFSLIELLVALSILAVVAAVIVPRFLHVTSQASLTVLTQNISQLNSTYQQFAALGGQILTSGVGNNPREAPDYACLLGDAGNTGQRQLSQGNFIRDTLGPTGSWTISLPMTIYSGGPGALATDVDDATSNGYTFSADKGAAIPNNSFVISQTTYYLYFKANGLFYQIDFDATNGFYIDPSSANGLPPSTSL